MLNRRIHAPQIGIPQPTGLPPHMQRVQSPRPGSPRPASPSPFAGRASSLSSRPSSPALPPLPTEALVIESDAVLLIRNSPSSVNTREPFSLEMTLAIRTPDEFKDTWRMYVQHLRPTHAQNDVPIAELASILNSPESQRRLSLTESISERAEIPSPRNPQSSSFPRPYDSDLPDALRTSKIRHLGPSVIPVDMPQSSKPPTFTLTSPNERCWDFELDYVATRGGLSSIGGLRAILVKDGPEQEHVILKKWDVFAEIWVLGH
jgi:hypothetical protein